MRPESNGAMGPWADTSATMSQTSLSCLKINHMNQLYQSWVFTRRDKSTQHTDSCTSLLTVHCLQQLRNGTNLAVINKGWIKEIRSMHTAT